MKVMTYEGRKRNDDDDKPKSGKKTYKGKVKTVIMIVTKSNVCVFYVYSNIYIMCNDLEGM